MGEPRKFFKTEIAVVVLSEDVPIEFDSLKEVDNAITTGDCSGQYTVTSQKEVPAKEMVKLLAEQGSEPGFFRLDEDGNEVKEG